MLGLALCKPDSEEVVGNFCRDVVPVYDVQNKTSHNYIYDKQVYENNCHELAQVVFWRRIMHLSKDSALVNFSSDRKIVSVVCTKKFNSLSDSSKTAFRDSLRKEYGRADTARVLVTEGKSFFYDFEHAYPTLHQGIDAFIENNTDPWYAQAILLIESPNRLQKSNVGAYGPFQLMKPVARLMGLKVNKKIDERADFNRSAYASSKLIRTICIPQAKSMLNDLNISYKEDDLWFRLLVMHVYHAGGGNVRAVLNKINPCDGGIDLINTMWHTSAGGFKSASQNYSQLVLAALLEMDQKVLNNPNRIIKL